MVFRWCGFHRGETSPSARKRISSREVHLFQLYAIFLILLMFLVNHPLDLYLGTAMLTLVSSRRHHAEVRKDPELNQTFFFVIADALKYNELTQKCGTSVFLQINSSNPCSLSPLFLFLSACTVIRHFFWRGGWDLWNYLFLTSFCYHCFYFFRIYHTWSMSNDWTPPKTEEQTKIKTINFSILFTEKLYSFCSKLTKFTIQTHFRKRFLYSGKS